MKNSLFISILALGSVAFAAESYTLSPVAEGVASAELHGWAQSLDSAHLTDLTLPEEVSLDSVTVQSASSGSYDGGSVKLAVYTSDAISADTFVGISTNTIDSWAVSTSYTFNFEGVTLDSSTSYVYRYVTADSTTASQTSSYFRVAISTADLLEGEAFYVYSGSKSWESAHSPYATYKVSEVAPVPEPATATLSLLALAGLAARRRRK